MSDIFLSVHITFVSIFLVFMLLKTTLLLTNNKTLLDKVRAKTKIVDMILGTLIIVTGLGLIMFKGNISLYLFAKIFAVFAAIPLGIIGLKRGKKVLAILSVVLLLYTYGVAETKSYKLKKNKFSLENSGTADAVLNSNQATLVVNGKAIYAQLCVECHGEDGKKGFLNAKDLTASVLSRQEKINIVTNGKGSMTKFDSQLAEEDIEAVVSYIETLK